MDSVTVPIRTSRWRVSNEQSLKHGCTAAWAQAPAAGVEHSVDGRIPASRFDGNCPKIGVAAEARVDREIFDEEAPRWSPRRSR